MGAGSTTGRTLILDSLKAHPTAGLPPGLRLPLLNGPQVRDRVGEADELLDHRENRAGMQLRFDQDASDDFSQLDGALATDRTEL